MHATFQPMDVCATFHTDFLRSGRPALSVFPCTHRRDSFVTLPLRKLLGPAGFFLAGAAVAAAVYAVSLREGLDTLQRTAQARLAQSNDRFLGQVTRFQQLVNSLARHPQIGAVAAGKSKDDISDLMLTFALASGAGDVFLVNHDGVIIASSDYRGAETPGRVGRSVASSDYIQAALDGGLGWSHGLEELVEPRMLYFARAVFGEDGPVIGSVVVSVSVAALEFEWSFGLEPVAYFDQAGVIFVTNRPDLALQRDPSLTLPRARRVQFPTDGLPEIFDYRSTQLFGHRIWRDIDSDVLPDAALVLARYIPRIELQAAIFQDIRPVQERAFLFALLSSALVGLIGLGVWVTNLRRRALAERLLAEEAANEQLEARVDARTQELRETQKQLIAAGRLSALGEMSAGISHELNQPLAAMQNFAENGKKLIEKGRTEQASENFDRLREQVDRVGRIIRSLRAFARKEEQEIRAIDISEAVDRALAISDIRLRRNGVEVERHGFGEPVTVSAGQVRLEQVLVNILGNAIDALADSDVRKITFDLQKMGNRAHLSIRDTGPGIEAPDQVFEPFYSTKDPGSSNGMGLGLSISHGIIGSFSGTLACRNTKGGGAEFEIELPLVETVP